MATVLAVVAAIALLIAGVVSQPDSAKRAAVLRRAGFGLMALFTFLFALFLIGETFTDPGGWKAAGLVAAWAVPLAGLVVLAWLRPDWAICVFTVLTAAATGVSIWFALNPHGWRSFENQHGPVRAVITFVLVTGIAVLGRKRTAVAGVLLLAVGVIPVAVSSLGSFRGFASLSVVSVVPVITGVLYLISACFTGSAERPRAA